MSSGVSRYQFRELPDGFAVEGQERPPVEVTFLPHGLEGRYVGESAGGASERFGFFNFGKLLEFVSRGLMRDWRPHEGWYGARAWAHQQTAKALARRLREQWLRLLGRADPDVLAVQRAIFAATFGDAALASEPALYRERYLVRDIVAYPAAAIAVRNTWALSRDWAVNRLHGSEAARGLRELARGLNVELSLLAEAPEPDVATQLARLGDWKSLFSDTAESYRSLNRTLMNLPGRVPHRLVCNLRLVHLDRPIEARLELLAVALYAGLRVTREAPFAPWADHGPVLLRASAVKLREALARLSRHLRQPLSPRRAADVRQLIQFLADYPEPHAGHVLGLTDRAIRWHRDRHEERAAEMRRHYGADAPTKRPPIPLPEVRGVTFLGTVGAICAEAERMRHCVASYVDQAVWGGCYLFHVEHKGEEATIEVGPEGRVRQAQGPHNRRNAAASYGKRVLNRWAAQLPRGPYAPPRSRGRNDDDAVPF
jgi:hypothetical protein